MNGDDTETEQSALWRGTFGDAYTERNAISTEHIAMRAAMWRRILKPIDDAPPASVLEVGANLGTNLRALRQLLDAELHALEPNMAARDALIASGVTAAENVHDAFGDSIPMAGNSVDMAFTCGVLIHVAPDHLLDTYRELHRVSRKYLVTIEYFADREVETSYRGHDGQLFKRDFGAVWLDHYNELELVDYGFFWKRATGLDNLTWWLFRKP